MNTVEFVHMGFPPVSCGRKSNTDDYLRWKIYWQQLWRFQSYVDTGKPVTAYVKSPPKEHKTPPRKGDLVKLYLSGERFDGVILYLKRDAEEAVVKLFRTEEIQSFDLDSFETAQGERRIRWVIHA